MGAIEESLQLNNSSNTLLQKDCQQHLLGDHFSAANLWDPGWIYPMEAANPWGLLIVLVQRNPQIILRSYSEHIRPQSFLTKGQIEKIFMVQHRNTRSQCHQVDQDFSTPCVDRTDHKVASITRGAAGIHKKQHNRQTSTRGMLTAPRGTALFHNPYLTVINFEASYRSLWHFRTTRSSENATSGAYQRQT